MRPWVYARALPSATPTQCPSRSHNHPSPAEGAAVLTQPGVETPESNPRCVRRPPLTPHPVLPSGASGGTMNGILFPGET